MTPGMTDLMDVLNDFENADKKKLHSLFADDTATVKQWKNEQHEMKEDILVQGSIGC
jgi:hypothetical protein